MKKKKMRTVIAILMVLLIASMSVSEIAADGKLKTYTNEKYGYSFQYPEELYLSTINEQFLHLGKSFLVEIVLISFPYSYYWDSYEDYVKHIIPDAYGQGYTEIVGGHHARVFEGKKDGIVGEGEYEKIYCIERSGYSYTITIETWMDNDNERIYAKYCKPIIESFHFTSPPPPLPTPTPIPPTPKPVTDKFGELVHQVGDYTIGFLIPLDAMYNVKSEESFWVDDALGYRAISIWGLPSVGSVGYIPIGYLNTTYMEAFENWEYFYDTSPPETIERFIDLVWRRGYTATTAAGYEAIIVDLGTVRHAYILIDKETAFVVSGFEYDHPEGDVQSFWEVVDILMQSFRVVETGRILPKIPDWTELQKPIEPTPSQDGVGEKEIEQIVEDYMQSGDEGYSLFNVTDGEGNLFHVVLYWKDYRQTIHELTGTLVIDSNKVVVDPNATSEKLFYIPILYCTLGIDSMWNPKAHPNTAEQMRDNFAELEESLRGASTEWDRISKGMESDMELQFAALTIVSNVATLQGLILNPPLTLLLEIKELGTYVAGAIAQESLGEFYHRIVIEEAEAIRDTLGEMATTSGEYSRVWQTLIDEDIYVGSGVSETAERAFPINDSPFDRIVEGQIVVLQKIKGLGNIIGAPESDLQVIDDGITEYQRLKNNIESKLTPAFDEALNLFVTKQRPIPAATPKTEEGEWQLLLTDPDEPKSFMDIKEVYAKVWEGNIYFKVILHDPWPGDPYEYVEASIFLDTDQSPDTGVDSGSLWYGVNDIGADYRVGIYKDCNELVKLDTSAENYSLWQTNLTYLSLPLKSNTFEVGVKLSDIGNPNAIDIIMILIDTEDGNMYWDYAPDEGKGHATYTICYTSEWQLIHSKFVDFDDDSLDTTISFYQRGHNIRVQVDGSDPGDYQINSGSVSISVDEDVHVHYNTGSVFGLLYQENDSKAIKPKMTRDEKTLLFLAGFIPGIEPGFGIVQYAIETTDHYEYDWYEEDDLTDSNLVPSIFFDSNDMLNSQDTIVIPWYLGTGYLPANSIRVNCPEMIFPEAGTYNIVFRVEYSIGLRISMLGKKVGYDVAIPITVV